MTGSKRSRRRRAPAFVLALAAALAAGCAPPRPAPEPITTIPDFTLTERDGSQVARADLLGREWVADFVFTRCALYCPRLTARMKELRAKVPADVRFVSFSVDPGHDTPEVLSAYAAKWGIAGRDWLFLTGTKAEIWTLVEKGFLLPVADAPEVEAAPILHSNRFVVVDAEGRMRSAVEAFEPGALERIVADLAALRREREGSR